MKQNNTWLWLMAVLFFPLMVWAEDSRLTDIQVSQADGFARITFTLTQLQQYHVFSLTNPDRIVVDFPETQLAVNLKKIAFEQTEIQSIRSGHPRSKTLRLVFDVKKMPQFKAVASENKILLDMHNTLLQSVGPIVTSDVVKPKKAVMTFEKAAKPFVVVIDPGHGGKDTGAIGEKNTTEKQVVLAISKKLAALINQQPNMRAVLTRDGDYFVPLRGRLKLARKGKADLFVAIHADSYFNVEASGASVYALSHRGATSEAARWLAKRENTSELGGVDLGELNDKSYVLRSVLIDLAQTATITDSLRLGTLVLDSLENITKLHYSRVEQAPFVVLKSPDIPSILVETGFISNPKEEEKLRDPTYQNKIARALFDGVRGYVKKYSSVG